MKIAIFGYPRSGTTMLNYIIHQHLIAAGVVEKWAAVGEVFNPLENTRLLVSKDGHLVNYTNLNLPESQPREERLRLFREHMDDDYIIKMLPYDTNTGGVVAAVVEAGYRIIAIERRNPLSAFLSVIIAYHHQVWHTYDDDQPVYEPFEVSAQDMYALGKSVSVYYHHRDALHPSNILYYEDIASNPVVNTLKELGLYQEGTPTKESPTKKLLSFEEKTKLIINLEEVVDHLTGILTPYTVTMEHNNL
jgi:hypothetical protein